MNAPRNGSGNYYNPAPSPYSASSRQASPGDTDIFMAIASSVVAETPQQPQAYDPYQPSQPSYEAQPGYGAQAQQYQSSHAAPNAANAAPVNPLVAARSSSAGAHGSHSAQGGLFPIQEVNPSVQRGFDTTFGERGGKKTILLVLLVIALIAAVFVGGFYLINQKQAASAKASIDEAVEVLRSTDNVIVPLDAAIASQVSTGISGDALNTLMLQSSSTATRLSTTETLVNEADRYREYLSEADVAALDALKADISGRRSLIEIGRMLLTSNSAADKASESLAMAYGCIAKSNDLVAQSLADYVVYDAAVRGLADAGGITIWTILEKDMNAEAAMTEAQTWIAAAKEALPEADFSVLENYVNLRLEYLHLLVEIDTFIGLGDSLSAEALMPAYTTADANSQAAYLAVPATAADLLSGVYAQNGANQQASYTAAHEKTLAADTQLNTYLGITDPSKMIGLSSSGQGATTAAAQAASLTEATPAPTGEEQLVEDVPAAA